jgi:hypothetical protein
MGGSLRRTPKTIRWSPSYRLGTDWTENAVSNSHIVSYVSIAAVTWPLPTIGEEWEYLQIRSLETAVYAGFTILLTWHNTLTRMPIARQRLGKLIPAQANSLNNMTSIARQQISKHTSFTIEVVFSVGSMQSGYKEVFERTE